MSNQNKVIFNSQLSNENTSTSKTKTKNIEDVENRPGFFRKAIPVMPKPLAIICCLFNILTPGLGTLIASFSVFCGAKHRYDSNIKSFFVNILAFILQLCSAFIIFGWIWSIKYGLLMVHLSDNRFNDDIIDQELPMYVRRHSSMEANILIQQKSRSSERSVLSRVKEEDS